MRVLFSEKRRRFITIMALEVKDMASEVSLEKNTIHMTAMMVLAEAIEVQRKKASAKVTGVTNR
jgi:uncharacterized protein YqgQ